MGTKVAPPDTSVLAQNGRAFGGKPDIRNFLLCRLGELDARWPLGLLR